MMFQQIADGPLQLMLQWLTMSGVLAVRSCSRALYARMTGPFCSQPRLPAAYHNTPTAMFCDIPTVSGSKLLLQMYESQITIDAAFVQRALESACHDGLLIKVQWLVAQFGSLFKFHHNNWEIFHCACASGNLAMVQWLVERFAITAAVIRANYRHVCLRVCRSGNVSAGPATWNCSPGSSRGSVRPQSSATFIVTG